MKLVFILGSVAVGKMTVGQELTKITKLQLLHNHLMYDLLIEHFGEDFASHAADNLKDVIYEKYSETDNYGLIITLAINFDAQSEWDELNRIADIFKETNAEIYYVNLIASQEIRLQRNKTENRLKHKAASKRNIEKSDKHLIEVDNKCRFIGNDEEFIGKNCMKIDNSAISPDIVAKMIKEKFSL